MAKDSAAERLTAAFDTRAEGVRGDVVGVFGDGLPEALIVAAGGVPADIKAPPPGEVPVSDAVSSVIEPFMDDYARAFLHRFAAGRFDQMAALILCRDDVAGLTAYQYASEMRRQGIVRAGRPRLFLWNLLHTDTAPAHRFNRTQADKLTAFLRETLGPRNDALAAALDAEAARLAAITRMDVANIDPADALIWRNAGRWLDAATHAALLDEAVAAVTPAPRGPRLGLVGSATEDVAFHRMLARFGPLTDLQPYGQPWPACHAGGPDLDGLLRAVAAYPLHLRAAPPRRFGDALLARLDGGDLVISQVDANDDSFGWEVPTLRDALAARGVPLVDLGFRPFRPDAAWLDTARARIEKALP